MSYVKFTFLTVIFCLSSLAQSAEKKTPQDTPTEPTKEMRAQMLQMHEHMAACLKSNKPFFDCHQEMMATCPMAKDGNCPFMGSKMPMMYHHQMMQGQGMGPGCCAGSAAPDMTTKVKK